MNKEVIQIEIMRSEYKENSFNVRIGDIKGSTGLSNFSKEEVLEEISDEINKLKCSETDINTQETQKEKGK